MTKTEYAVRFTPTRAPERVGLTDTHLTEERARELYALYSASSHMTDVEIVTREVTAPTPWVVVPA